MADKKIQDDIQDCKEYATASLQWTKYETIEECVQAAREEAFNRGIEANTIIINKNLAFVKEFFLKDPYFRSVSKLPPMIMGLEVQFADMPEKRSFLLFEAAETEREKETKAIERATAKKILDRVHQLFGGGWLSELYREYGIDLEDEND